MRGMHYDLYPCDPPSNEEQGNSPHLEYRQRVVQTAFVQLPGILSHQSSPRLFLNTHTYTELIMSTKTISITEEAYERLRALKNNEKTSFSEVIVKYYPVKRKLSDVLAELGDCSELADSVEKVSREMRKSRMHEVKF